MIYTRIAKPFILPLQFFAFTKIRRPFGVSDNRHHFPSTLQLIFPSTLQLIIDSSSLNSPYIALQLYNSMQLYSSIAIYIALQLYIALWLYSYRLYSSIAVELYRAIELYSYIQLYSSIAIYIALQLQALQLYSYIQLYSSIAIGSIALQLSTHQPSTHHYFPSTLQPSTHQPINSPISYIALCSLHSSIALQLYSYDMIL